MSFKFNFGEATNNEDSLTDKKSETQVITQNPLRPCKVHQCDLKCDLSSFEWSAIDVGKHTLRFVTPEFAANNITNTEITSLITSSDLRSGEYEGGLKVWECTFDVLDYLEEKGIGSQATVFDMGCGAGLLGLFALLEGARSVCFQDYNSEVIESFTLPSVCSSIQHAADLKPDDGVLEGRLNFFSGDWDAVGCFLESEGFPKFDLVLSSETIYNTEYYPKILDFLQAHLSDTGEALFAAKTHYFGVGGGTYDFVNFVTKNGNFKVSVVKKIEQGLTREILKVCKKTVG